MPILASFTGARAFGFNKQGLSNINRLVLSTVIGKTSARTADGTLLSSSASLDVDYISSNNKLIIGTRYDTNAVSTSVDGVTWATISLPNTGGATTQTMCSPDMYMVLKSNHPSYYSSSDGTAWTYRDLPITPYIPTGAYGAGKYIILSRGSSSYVYSSDGINWTTATLPSSGAWISTTYINGKFFTLNFNTNTYLYSSDGVSWSTGTFNRSNFWNHISYGNGVYMVTGSGASGATNLYITSTDGVNWTDRITPESSSFADTAFVDGYFWGVGITGPTRWYRSSTALSGSWTQMHSQTYSGDMNSAILINTAG